MLSTCTSKLCMGGAGVAAARGSVADILANASPEEISRLAADYRRNSVRANIQVAL